CLVYFFFFQAEDGIRDFHVTGVQTCALPILAIYMPMIPEAIITMLACARLGLTHSVVFAGFSSSALRSRVDDAQAKLVVTVDGQWRRGQAAPLKPAVDEAVADAESIERVLVVKRADLDVDMKSGRDVRWDR